MQKEMCARQSGINVRLILAHVTQVEKYNLILIFSFTLNFNNGIRGSPL